MWAIIIPTYQRHERLFTCLRCLGSAMANVNEPFQILIMDSAPEPKLRGALSTHRNTTYAHLPRANQSTLRNAALSMLDPAVEKLLLLDSDIYLSKDSLRLLDSAFKQDENLVAVAPPLAPYVGGKHKETLKSFAHTTRTDGKGLIMPSPYEYSTRNKTKDFLETLMLRGAFALRREAIVEVFGDSPWLPVFTLWQNVPFFLTLRELGKRFGYILNPAATALHDERPHADTVRSLIPLWHAETIKSIILLMFRNHLYESKQRKLNSEFLKRISPVLEQHLLLQPQASFKNMLEASKLLSLNKEEAIKSLNQLAVQVSDPRLREAITLLLSHEWESLQLVRSQNIMIKM